MGQEHKKTTTRTAVTWQQGGDVDHALTISLQPEIRGKYEQMEETQV
jgi:hypothetical protein